MGTRTTATNTGLGDRVGEAFGELVQRRNRAHLYNELIEGLDPAVTITTYPVISGIQRLGPITATDLSVDIGLDRTVTSRYAAHLEEAGLVRRQTDPDDPRKSLLSLTPKGERIVDIMRKRLADAFERQLAGWPAAEARSFVNGLERFVQEQRRARQQP